MLHFEKDVKDMDFIERIEHLEEENTRLKNMLAEAALFQAQIDIQINKLILDKYILEPEEKEYYKQEIKEDEEMIKACEDFEIRRLNEHLNKDWILDNL